MKNMSPCVYLFPSDGKEYLNDEDGDEIANRGGHQVQRLQDGLHGGRRLRVGELQAGDGEEDFADGDDQVLGQQPEDVDGVGLGDSVPDH